MKLKNMFNKAAIITLSLVPVLTVIACSNVHFNTFQKALNNKETFVAYIGSGNCDYCEKLHIQWDKWLNQEDWKSDIILDTDNMNTLNSLKRYTFVEPYKSKDGLATFGKLSWVKKIKEWTEKEIKNLYKTNDEIKRTFTGEHTYNGSIPLLLFVKEGKFRWFMTGWGENKNETNDLNLKPEDFTSGGKASWNVSTLKRMTKDFIFGDFKDFYKEISSSKQ